MPPAQPRNLAYNLGVTLATAGAAVLAAATIPPLLARCSISGPSTDDAELPPALLTRYARQFLKSGFRAIHRLLEFTADPPWLATL